MQVLTRIFLFACLTSLSLFGVAQEAVPPSAESDTQPGQDINPPVLKVNGDTVYAAEISMVMANIAGQFGGQDQPPDDQQLLQMRLHPTFNLTLTCRPTTWCAFKLKRCKTTTPLTPALKSLSVLLRPPTSRQPALYSGLPS